MGFDAQAFATAFLQGQAVDIKERFDKAEKFREEELEKAQRNLPLYKKRQLQKKSMLQLAASLEKLNIDPANIMYYAKDGPQSLQMMSKIIHDKNKAYHAINGEDLPPEKLNEMMKIPQGFEEAASEYDSLADFLDNAYSLSNDNDKTEKPENPEIMQGNWRLGLMGYGAKEKERERLETEKFVGDVTIAELNRMAGEQDFADPFGGAFAPAPIDFTAGPRIIDDNTRISILDRKQNNFDKYTEGNTTGRLKLNSFLDNKVNNGEITKDEKADYATAFFSENPKLDSKGISVFKEFSERMEYEAYKDASIGFHRDDAEMSQISPEFLALHKKYGVPKAGQVTHFSTIKAFGEALDNKSLKVGDTVTVMAKDGLQTHTITAEDLK